MSRQLLEKLAETEANITNNIEQKCDALEDRLSKKLDDTEASLITCMNSKCDTIDEHVKQYIKTVMTEYIDKIIKNTQTNVNNVTVTEAQAESHDESHETTDTEQTGTPTPIGDTQAVKHDTETTLSLPKSPVGENTGTPPSQISSLDGQPQLQQDGTINGEGTNGHAGRLRAATVRHVKHDVYIGNMITTTTEDAIRAQLMCIGVTHIVSVTKLDDVDSSVAFRVKINDDTIKHNVYNRTNFDNDIIVKPYKYMNIDGASTDPAPHLADQPPRMQKNAHNKRRKQHDNNGTNHKDESDIYVPPRQQPQPHQEQVIPVSRGVELTDAPVNNHRQAVNTSNPHYEEARQNQYPPHPTPLQNVYNGPYPLPHPNVYNGPYPPPHSNVYNGAYRVVHPNYAAPPPPQPTPQYYNNAINVSQPNRYAQSAPHWLNNGPQYIPDTRQFANNYNTLRQY